MLKLNYPKISITKMFFFLFLSMNLLLNFSCNTTEPPNNQTLKLELEDVSCTEAWLQLTSANIQMPNNISLLINGSVAKTFNLSTQDSLLYIDSLLPNQTYKLKVSSIQNQVSSNELTISTMDTTSHNFSWQTFTFGGDCGSSVLYDIAIIDENNIWAVGEIYVRDSLGNCDPTFYNAVHWNGATWELKRFRFNCRLYFPNCGPDTMLISPGYSIFARNENDIWIASGCIHHFDGIKWSEQAGIWGVGSASKIWGNDNDLWCVGSNGFIAHQTSSGSWTKIESGTDLNINDIWGDFNEKTQEWEILAVASNILQSYEKEVIKINKANSMIINKVGIEGTLSSIWFKSNRKYLVAGSGIYEKKNINEISWQGEPYDITTYFIYKLRGNKMNDIIAVGGLGEVLHYNGFSWKSYLYDAGLEYGNYYSIIYKNDKVAICGFDNRLAVITLGTHQ